MSKKEINLWDKVLTESSQSQELDLIFNTIDDLMLDGEYEKVETLLRESANRDLPVVLLVGILTVTLTWKNELRNRAAVYERTYKAAAEASPDRLFGIMRGLE